MDWLLTAIWYLALGVGIRRAYRHALKLRHATDPLEKARHAAQAFFTCGLVLWAFAVLDDARREVHSPFDLGDMLGVIGGAIGWAIFMLGPTWLPLRLLSGQPGPSRCGIAAFIARAVAVFAAGCIGISPFMFMFANSLGEYGMAILVVAIPMLILIYAALKTGKYASLAGDVLESRLSGQDQGRL